MKKFDFISFGEEFKKAKFRKQVERNEKISLRDISKETNISAPTLSRAENGSPIEVDNILNLCDWAGLKFELFVTKI